MQTTWRTPLKNYIEEYYIQKSQEWFELNLSPSGRLNMTIVSDQFEAVPLQERREQIWEILRQHNAPTSTGFLSLYTLKEAEAIGLLHSPDKEENPVYTWLDLAHQAANIEDQPKTLHREPRIPRTVSFYSFKGGVGRTTALTHVAAILALRGRKVVAVDLDIEAPGLGSALNMNPSPQYGIVDYFYERAYIPEGVEPSISITEIFSEIRIPDAPGRLFVVPAGTLDLDYLAKVDDLRSSITTESGEDLWSIFYREITEQLQPDMILVDSRTGFNEWGAFSLLRAADKAIIFLYPNEQNSRGIGLILEALSTKISTSFVFSPVPFVNEGGMEMVKKHWSALQVYSKDEETLISIGDPIVIPYITGMAMATSYPVQELLSYYMPIANVVEEETHSIRLQSILANAEYRRAILESLTFPELNITKDTNTGVYALFQRTAVFDKFLDPTTYLIHGRKGTGKSTLYWLWLKHRSVAMDLSRGRLRNVTFLSAHGAFQLCLTPSDFQQIGQSIISRGSWETIWRSYLLLRLYMSNHLHVGTYLREVLAKNQNKFYPLEALLKYISKNVNHWRVAHTETLIKMVTTPELDSLIKDILSEIDAQYRKRGWSLWFFYDNLDVDLKGEVREKALIGLFQLVQSSRRLESISFKIFLSEDTWSLLSFENKNYFHGRDLLLQWTQTDFLRLVLHQALQSEKFKEIVDRFSPIESIDRASEDSLNEALQALWGNRWDPKPNFSSASEWLYSHLEDGSRTVLPQSINILLREATRLQLQTNREQPFPPDRLLSTQSLYGGLIKASQERCEEIHEAYPELQPFFEFLQGKDIYILLEDLRRIWQEKIKTMLPNLNEFEEFITFLHGIGLIDLPLHLDEEESFFSVAPIYTYGFGMKTNADAER